MKKYSILFVCMGNICRSPTAHGVFRQKVIAHGLVARVSVDSAGTHNYHPGSPPDARSQTHASRRGYDLSDLRARRVKDDDFICHDLILVMDMDNLTAMQSECPPEQLHKVRLLTEFCRLGNRHGVPDPYYGAANGFEAVLDLIEDACEGLILHLKHQGNTASRPADMTVRPDQS